MNDKTNAIELFEKFATERLNNHLAELNTRYENKVIDKQTLEKGYSSHKEILSKELDDKIKELSAGQNNKWLHTELQNQKQAYLSQLIFTQTEKLKL